MAGKRSSDKRRTWSMLTRAHVPRHNHDNRRTKSTGRCSSCVCRCAIAPPLPTSLTLALLSPAVGRQPRHELRGVQALDLRARRFVGHGGQKLGLTISCVQKLYHQVAISCPPEGCVAYFYMDSGYENSSKYKANDRGALTNLSPPGLGGVISRLSRRGLRRHHGDDRPPRAQARRAAAAAGGRADAGHTAIPRCCLLSRWGCSI